MRLGAVWANWELSLYGFVLELNSAVVECVQEWMGAEQQVQHVGDAVSHMERGV